MNDGRSALPFSSPRRHLGQINGAGLTETTNMALRGGGEETWLIHTGPKTWTNTDY